MQSLSSQEDRLSDRLQFLLDASLGLIGVEQNDVFKVLTIVSVIGIPPTLIASMYGMNFKNIPEYDWAWGYPYGLTLIVFSGLAAAVVVQVSKMVVSGAVFSEAALAAARALIDLCRARGLKIVTAESCTGGLVAALLTEIAGSSDVVERGFVTYSNEAKQELLGVSGGDACRFRRSQRADGARDGGGRARRFAGRHRRQRHRRRRPRRRQRGKAGRPRAFRLRHARRRDRGGGAPLRRSRPRRRCGWPRSSRRCR